MKEEAAAAGGECLGFLADLHAISMPHVPAELTASTRAMTAALVACGIDPDCSTLFNQARVPAHAELQWLLNGTARMAWLNRMTQWKDKEIGSASWRERVCQYESILVVAVSLKKKTQK